MREIYVDASSSPVRDVFWGYDGENNSAKLNIKLPDYMIGEKFSYKACFEDAALEITDITPNIDSDTCSLTLLNEVAIRGRLKLQIVASSPSTPVKTTHRIRINGSPDKIQLYSDGYSNTLTRTSDGVSINTHTESGFEIWSVCWALNECTYGVREKYGKDWVDNGVKLEVVNEQVVKTPVISLIIR